MEIQNNLNIQNPEIQETTFKRTFSSSLNNATDIQLVFASLQNELAASNKELAREKINGIKENQARSKEITEAVVSLRNAMSGLKEDDTVTGEKIQNFEQIIKTCNDLGIKVPIGDAELSALKNLKAAKDSAVNGGVEVAEINDIKGIRNMLRNSDINFNTKHYPNYTNISTRDLFGVNNIGWKTVSTDDVQELMDNIMKGLKIKVADLNLTITSLQNMQETIGSDVQQEMLLIQDMMSKVSSYTQGAASAINKSGDTLSAILR
jgi:hypothetical protein